MGSGGGEEGCGARECGGDLEVGEEEAGEREEDGGVGTGAAVGGEAVCFILAVFWGKGSRWRANSICVYRVEDMETKIGGGLIEEVIQVAEGELKLADVMIQNKV